MNQLVKSLRPALFALGVALVPVLAGPASAQGVLALVNSRPVTSLDVEQRIRIAALTERRRLDRKSALTELIDDQVKLAEARRIGYRITEEGVESEFEKLAKANKQNIFEFEANLKRAGIQPSILKDKMRADLAWGVLLRDQAKRGTQVSNAELEGAIEQKKREAAKVTEFHLLPVVVVVAGGDVGAAQRTANAARAKFTSCETSLDELRQMPNVALRPMMIRSSADLPKPLLATLDKTPVGRLSPPGASDQGIEMVAICEKKVLDNPEASRSNVATALSEKKISENAKSYLAELRKKVEIQYR